MMRSTKKMATDKLDGYRARTQDDEENEVIVRSIRGLSEKGIDYHSIAEVIQSEDLVRAISEDTPLAKLVNFCAGIIKENTYQWSMVDDPSTVNNLHLQTRAARMVIAWTESILDTGKVAVQQIQQQDPES